MMSIRCLSRVLCCAAASAAFTAAAAAAEPRSAPGAFGVSAKAEAVVMPLLPDTAPTREIRLAPPLSNEPHAMSKSDIVVDKNRPLRIGYDRLPAAADRRIALARLPWQALSDGSLAARVAVTSPTAAGVRLHIGLSGVAGVIAARFKSTQDSGRVYFADTGALTGTAGYWSPVLEGETAIVEFSLPPGAVPQGDLTVQSVGHLLITAATAKTLQDIGHADACEHDVACVQDPLSSLHRAASSVAETVVSDGGFIILCTATLLNTVPQTGIPYLMTAYHCYDEDHVRTEQEVQDIAGSMTTWWFFDATACGSNVPGPYQQVAGGATLVYRGPEIDFVLFRLNTSPPAGAWFSAWDATPVPSGTSALVLHHPEGDLKKLSSGNTLGYTTFNGLGSYIEMGYGYGSTEAGSSGSPLLTCSAVASGGNCNDYAVRGALLGGIAACDDPSGTDAYSRLDLAYPYVAKYLAPAAVSPSGNGVAVEFYNVDLDHYFITADGAEQINVDNGSAGPGWFRTGNSFNTLAVGSASGVPVCRFYGSVSPGPNSHFYTLDPRECQFLKDLQATQPASQPRWNYEGIAFMNFATVAGSCPSGTAPIYRYYNNGFPTRDSNHRFVTSRSADAFMLSQGWSYEGLVMCSPIRAQ
jgi:lysyl endopeptidase